MALPTAYTAGYTTFRGKVCCVCLAKWLLAYQRLLLARKLIKVSIDPWQLTGGAAASGGTHTKGGVFDLLYQTTAAHVNVAREMGAPATWARTTRQGFTKAHLHGVLSGCPHNGPAAYQVVAQRRGYNGLGQARTGAYAGQWGYGARDEFPPPKTYRTWQQGVAWADAEVKRLTAKPPAAAPPRPPAVAPPRALVPATVLATKTALDVFPDVVPLQHEHTLTAKVTPTTATGTVQFQWHNGDGQWRNFGQPVRVAAGGVAKVANRPGRAVDHRYRAVFTPSTKAYKGSASGTVLAPVIDLLALRRAIT